jgi:hypothetical protein
MYNRDVEFIIVYVYYELIGEMRIARKIFSFNNVK